MRAPALFALDAVLVLLFATIGRRSHEHGLTVPGVLTTVWPFWVGLLVGWGYTVARGGLPRSVRHSVPLWLLTVAVGHLLRIVSHQGTAVSFIIVSLVALAVFLLLPRYVMERRAAR